MSPASGEAPIRGLTTAEVRQRVAAGLTNRTPSRVSRPFRTIVEENLFTLFNAILFGIVVLLLAVGQLRDALLIGGLVSFTVVVGIFQETRAKLRLDRIALLAQPKVTAIRNATPVTIPPDQVVQGDYLVLRRGDQVVADGEVVRAHDLEVNQALLTGEAAPVDKRPGDSVLSGSYAVGGSGVYRATRVGNARYVEHLTRAARTYQIHLTPLQCFLNRILRFLLAIVVGLSVLQVLAFLVEGVALVPAIRATAVIATLVPQGLLLMSTVAYSLGALRVAERGGLVQRLNAVEELSHVDLLGTDKTGTLTTGQPVLRAIVPYGVSGAEARELLGAYVASTADRDPSLTAIAQALPHPPCPVRSAVPFQFERKWSSLTLGAPCHPGTYLLGAPEALLPYLAEGAALADEVRQRAGRGERLLLFSRAPGSEVPHDGDGVRLPAGLRAVALVALAEEIRPDARATLAAFRDQGVTLKILSGDNPQTVLAIAEEVGFPADARAISGDELSRLSEAEFARAVQAVTVFGRVDPEQKQRIIQALRAQGHTVAMIGDGANDILAMKAAQVGIAMATGSPATRGAADVVLLGDSFATLPAMLDAGRRIVNGMYSLIDLFLIRDIGTIELILVAGFVNLPFPFLPPQITIAALLTVGIPALFLVAGAASNAPPPASLQQVVAVTLPLGSALGFALIVVDLITWLILRASLLETQSTLVSAAVVGGLVALVLLVRQRQAAGTGLGSSRTLLLAGACFVGYLGALRFPPSARLFELQPIPVEAWLLVLAAVAVSFGAVAFAFPRRR